MLTANTKNVPEEKNQRAEFYSLAAFQKGENPNWLFQHICLGVCLIKTDFLKFVTVYAKENHHSVRNSFAHRRMCLPLFGTTSA